MKIQRQENMYPYSSFRGGSSGKLNREGELRNCVRMIVLPETGRGCGRCTRHPRPRAISPREDRESAYPPRLSWQESCGGFVDSVISRSATCSENVPEKLLAMRQYKADRGPSPHFGASGARVASRVRREQELNLLLAGESSKASLILFPFCNLSRQLLPFLDLFNSIPVTSILW